MKQGHNLQKNTAKSAIRLIARTACACAAYSFFASSAQAGVLGGDAAVSIEPPAAVANTQSLNFGKVVSGTAQTRLTINADTGVMTAAGGNAVPAGGTVSRAHFRVNSSPLLLITIRPPSGTTTLNRVGGGASMLVDTFTINGGTSFLTGTATRTLLVNGTFDFDIGGRLTVPANQPSGHYEGTFTVTVNFL